MEQKELEWQLEVFKKMGFGGAHMHVRTGMATPYLSDEHMGLIKACVDKAKKEEYQTMYDYDSLLLWLESVVVNATDDVLTGSIEVQSNSAEQNRDKDCVKSAERERCIALPTYVDYTLSEPNALLLDMAEYALDGGEWHAKEELLRLDVECRKLLGWSTDIAHVAQPWSLGEETEFHRVALRVSIESSIEYEGAQLAIEKAEDVKIRWNGKKVDNEVVGWYVDKAIQTIALPKIKQGENILDVEVPIGKLPMIYPPYIAKLGTVDAGKHTIDLTFYGTRQNGFGTLHLADEKRPYLNPSSWRTTGDEWCYEYMLRRMGVLATPEMIEKK